MNIHLMTIVFFFMLPLQELPTQQIENAQVDNKEDYRVGPGDSLSIKVFDMNQFDQTIRVSNSGKIHVPYLGVLKVVDMTVREIQSEIARQLIKLDLVKEPWVQVGVAEYRAHPVYILGEVMQPGQYLISKEMNVMDLVTLASGFGENSGLMGYLYRRKTENTGVTGKDAPTESIEEETIEIDFQKMYDGTHPELNLKLRGGDVLYVPERPVDYVFVVGDANRPGKYEIIFGEGMLASQAIAKAGGPTKTAKMSKGILVRYDEEGERQQFAVDFKAILNGKKEDIPILPNDIIFIPGSSAKTVAYGLLDILPRVTVGPLIY